MGLFRGTVRLRRYRVLGRVQPDAPACYAEAVQAHGFKGFSEGDERERVWGWVPADDPLDAELHPDRWIVGRAVVLALRIDTKRIPAAYFRQECRRVEAEWKARLGREDLARAEREEIRSVVRAALLGRVIPATQVVEAAWDLDRSQVLFANTAERTNELFRTLFEATFGLRLRPLFPYALAMEAAGEKGAELLDRVVPASFQPEGGAPWTS